MHATTTNTLGFSEVHNHGRHSLEWRFRDTLTTRDVERDVLDQTCQAVRAAPEIDRVIEAAGAIPKVSHLVSAVSVQLSAKSKRDFDVVAAIARKLLADVDPVAFDARIRAATEASLEALARKREADARAEHLICEAQSARELARRLAVDRAEEAFAAEIDDLRSRYDRLVGDFVERCQREADAFMASSEAFADLDDAQVVHDLVREIVAAKPLRFSGPSIQPPAVLDFGSWLLPFDKHMQIKAALIAKILGSAKE
jgi:hypothetical protein